jgi:hypothetical protein
MTSVGYRRVCALFLSSFEYLRFRERKPLYE